MDRTELNAYHRAWRDKRKSDPEFIEKVKKYRRTYRQNAIARDPEFFKNKKRREKLAKYGITPIDYDVMYKHQNGLCAICRERKPLVVDHSHASGKVRALLCLSCNFAIGLLKENKNTLRSAIEYLDNHDV